MQVHLGAKARNTFSVLMKKKPAQPRSVTGCIIDGETVLDPGIDQNFLINRVDVDKIQRKMQAKK
jgi:hypothetical protein